MDVNRLHTLISSALQRAFVDYPNKVDGTEWDKIYKSDEESALLANAVLMALENNKLKIVDE